MLPVEGPRGRTGRAAPLPPDERRSAILSAVQPMLLERGIGVSTRELAAAAGVAEGTLFRVFEDQTALIRAAAEAAADPVARSEDLAGIDLSLPLPERLAQAIEVTILRVGELGLWISLLHQLGRSQGGVRPHDGQFAMRQREARREQRIHLCRLLAPDAGRLRLPLDDAVELVELVIGGLVMERLIALRTQSSERGPTSELVVDAVLHGLLVELTPEPSLSKES